MKNPIISIIIPVYNTQKYLKRCLNSCVNQTLSEIEIIVVNDASPDDSAKIMKQYEVQFPEKIRCIYLKENMRQGGARNVALKCAKGEYVTFVDSDDWIHPDMCEELYRKSVEKNADIVYCNVLRERKDGYVINNRFADELLGIVDEEKIKLLIKQLYVGPWAHIIKTDIIVKNELFFPEKVIYEDMVITRMWDIHAKKIAKVENPFYTYCLNMESVGQAKLLQYKDDGFKCVKLLYKQLKENAKTRIYQKEREIICLHYALGIADGMLRRHDPRFRNRIQADFRECVNAICSTLNENEEWKYWFTSKEKTWLLSGIDFSYYQSAIDPPNETETYREYYKQTEPEIKEIMRWFAKRGKKRYAVWGKTNYADGFLQIFEDGIVIDNAKDVEMHRLDYILALRSLHCENIKHVLKGIKVDIFNIQGYLLGDRELEKYLV